ncbi:hypothetical protein A5648_15930 [Mycolicibacter sinensis]|uniref:Uncharacterized protein n=1 Tax=Mycolicibacter sinensis (strain JDM601) TaxID=875328 RepID=A0A1A3U7K3_MYCSD|nr:hypothetical protein A5648_15930 [Mycolicibacter sinensis]
MAVGNHHVGITADAAVATGAARPAVPTVAAVTGGTVGGLVSTFDGDGGAAAVTAVAASSPECTCSAVAAASGRCISTGQVSSDAAGTADTAGLARGGAIRSPAAYTPATVHTAGAH